MLKLTVQCSIDEYCWILFDTDHGVSLESKTPGMSFINPNIAENYGVVIVALSFYSNVSDSRLLAYIRGDVLRLLFLRGLQAGMHKGNGNK